MKLLISFIVICLVNFVFCDPDEVCPKVCQKLKISTGLDVNRERLGKPNWKDMEDFKRRLNKIFPGVLWCGDPSILAYDNEFDILDSASKCCEDHDKCADQIAPGYTKYDLTNRGLFPRNHCACEKKFFKCLKKANNMMSRKIGLTYFGVLSPQCYRRLDDHEEWFDNPHWYL